MLKVVLIELRQLPDELRQTDVLEVNDLANGLLVVGILVQPVARVNAYNKFVRILVQPVARAAGAVGTHTPRLELTAGLTFCMPVVTQEHAQCKKTHI